MMIWTVTSESRINGKLTLPVPANHSTIVLSMIVLINYHYLNVRYEVVVDIPELYKVHIKISSLR